LLTLAAASLLAQGSAEAHSEGQAAIAVSINDGGRVEMTLELGEDDVMELLGRASEDGASLFDEGSLDAALKGEVPGWIAFSGDAGPCPLSMTSSTRKGMKGVSIKASADCAKAPSTLGIDWLASRKTKLNLSAIAVVSGPSGVGHTLVLSPKAPSATVTISTPDALQTVTGFVFMGAEHILIGWDHLAFLLALLLACSTWRRLLMIVTAFTLAHSVTLALGATGLLRVPSEIVEPIIAASIAVAAAMALFDARSDKLTYPGSGMKDGPVWRELALCFGFGLIHGLGFASMLAESLASSKGVALPLLGFNLGVELGQIACVALAFPVLASVGRQSEGKKIITGALASLVALGVVVFIARIS
jgi:hypothetical protein